MAARCGLKARLYRMMKVNESLPMKFPPRLFDGYRTFLDHRLPLERSRYQKLAQTGQRPEVMMICCCDSRVSPEVIFDAHPGELFVLRNVANLVPPYQPTGLTHGVSAALEFAAQILEVKYIVVMGHSHCGGVRAYVEHEGRTVPGDFIDSWMGLIAPAAKNVDEAKKSAHADYLPALERASVVQTLANLMTFPLVRERVENRRLQLLGSYFDVATGELSLYDPSCGEFAPVAELAPQ
jgi:carbonic anhydrase